MILGLQITAILFALVMIYFALLHYQRRELSKVEMGIWGFIWGATILTTIFPEVLRTYAQSLAVTRLFDLMVVGGFILVLTMVSSAYVRMRRLENKLEEFIRNEAIKNVKTKSKK